MLGTAVRERQMVMKRVKIFNELKKALGQPGISNWASAMDLRVTEIPSPPTKKRRKKSTRSKLSQAQAD